MFICVHSWFDSLGRFFGFSETFYDGRSKDATDYEDDEWVDYAGIFRGSFEAFLVFAFDEGDVVWRDGVGPVVFEFCEPPFLLADSFREAEFALEGAFVTAKTA